MALGMIQSKTGENGKQSQELHFSSLETNPNRAPFGGASPRLGKIGTPLCQRKIEAGLGKWLANLCGRNKVRKKAHASRGQESKWEISTHMAGTEYQFSLTRLPGGAAEKQTLLSLPVPLIPIQRHEERLP
jgi:hypothetical protein